MGSWKTWLLLSILLNLAACGNQPSAKKPAKETNCVNCEMQKSSSEKGKTSQSETSEPTEPTAAEIAKAEEASTNPESGKGFFSIDSGEIPGVVKKSALSVFHVVVLSHKQEAETFVNVGSQALFEEEIEKIKALPSKNLKDQMQKKILNRILSVCAAHADVRIRMQCPIPRTFQHFTAFLAGAADLLWTSAESFHEVKDSMNEKKVLSAYVFDATGGMVINPLKEDVTLEEMNKHFARLKLSKPVGSPLVISKAPVRLGQNLFLVGYPSTEEESNQKGDQIQFSKGNLIDGNNLSSLFEIPTELLPQMLFYSADSEVGSRGSPVLNEKGEVLGIHVLEKTKETPRGSKRISVGALPFVEKSQSPRSESGSASP